MKKKLILVFMLACLLLMVTACTPSKTETPTPSTNSDTTTPSTNNDTTTPTTNSDTTTSVSADAAVSIDSFTFNPKVLTVPAGTTVVWTNNDSAKHNIISANFSSPEFGKGQTYEFKYDQKGSYDYYCGLHPAMTGTIIVE